MSDLYIKQVTDYLSSEYPENIAEEWDNTGLMLGNIYNKAEGILICLDVTSEVIEEAVNLGCNMIISHHPFIFKSLKRIDLNSILCIKLTKLIKNNITVYSMHTNLDYGLDGVNEQLALTLGLRNLTGFKQHPELLKSCDGMPYFLGRAGELAKPAGALEFAELVKQRLHAENIRLIGSYNNRMIIRAAVFSGAFDDDLITFAKSGCDVLITGDVKYHTAIDACELGLFIIDAGHYHTERVVLQALRQKLLNKYSDLRIYVTEKGYDPYKIY